LEKGKRVFFLHSSVGDSSNKVPLEKGKESNAKGGMFLLGGGKGGGLAYDGRGK